MPLRRVLCVGGSSDSHESLRLALVEIGALDVDFAISGGEALSQLASRIPDLILLDASLPDMTMAAAFAALRARSALAHAPILVLTAKAGASERAQYDSLGAAAVVALPADPIAVLAQIRALWDGAHNR